jgi:hypothetical protein
MIRLAWLPDGPYVLTDPTERLSKDGYQCMCSGIVRRATEEDLAMWRKEPA